LLKNTVFISYLLKTFLIKPVFLIFFIVIIPAFILTFIPAFILTTILTFVLTFITLIVLASALTKLTLLSAPKITAALLPATCILIKP
jgi:hypothetical protein